MSTPPESSSGEQDSVVEPGRGDRDVIAEAVTAFTDLCRKGERPDVEEFARRFPGRSDEVRELLSALLLMESCAPGDAPRALPVAAFAEMPQAPRRLGDYRLLREIGRGGMGIVYEAVQESLGRHVALKVLPVNAVFGERRLERFRREARAVAALHHSNIVPVFGIGEEDGLNYYAMQFIRGQALDEVLEEVKHLRAKMDGGSAGHDLARPIHPDSGAGRLIGSEAPAGDLSRALEPDTARPRRAPSSSTLLAGSEGSTSRSSLESRYLRNVVRLGLQAAEALAYAHEQGVLHRDIKPSNLLLDAEDRLWLTDFGLAKSENAADLTHTGELVGTLAYMAPERFKGWCDVRSDIYSLGVTLYECITLRPAFGDDDRVRLMKRVAAEEPPRPRRLDPHIPRDLETIVLKCMEKEPERRYACAEDLARDLRAFIADRPIAARPVSRPERAWRWCRRNAALSALLGASALFLVIASGTLLVARAAHVGKQAAEAAEREARYWQAFSRAQASRAGFAPGKRNAGLAAVEEASRNLDALHLSAEQLRSRRLELRKEAIACLALDDLEPGQGWPPCPGGAVCMAFDASFERYAVATSGGDITVRRVKGDAVLAVLRGTAGEAVDLRFSPDGLHLAVQVEKEGTPRLHLRDILHGRDILEAPLTGAGRGAPCDPFDFSPDGALLAVAGPGGDVALHEISSSRPPREIAVPGRIAVGTARFHPGGRRLAVAAGPREREAGAVFIIDVESGETPSKVLFEAGVQDLAWHPSGRYLAAACTDWRIRVADLHGNRRPVPAEEAQTLEFAIAYVSSGDTLATMSLDATLRLRDPFTGTERVRALETVRGRSLVAGRDGGLLAQSGRGVRVWRPLAARNYRALQCPSETRFGRKWGMELGAFSFSPRAGLLATAHVDGVRLWDLVWKEEVAHIEVPDAHAALFHPSGDFLITVSPSGIDWWPMRQEGGAVGEKVRIGPPGARGFSGRSRVGGAALDAVGRILVASHEGHFHVVDLETGIERVLPEHHWGNRWLDVSPDGKWLVTSGGLETRVWSLSPGAVVHYAKRTLDSIPRFTPDGARLVTSTGGRLAFLEVGTWNEVLSLTKDTFALFCYMDFSRDSGLAACSTASGDVCLLDSAGWEELATLSRPGPAIIANSLAFSPDGGTLAVSTSNHALVLWDLRGVRNDLGGLGLDWEGQPLAAAPSPARTARIEVEVIGESPPRPPPAELEKELARCAEMMARESPRAAESGR